MTIGELDRRIIIESPIVSTNSYGEVELDSWVEARTVWAKVEWDGGSEGNVTDKITATTKVNFYIRNLDLELLTTNTRIEFDDGVDSQYYYIHVINQIEGREQFLEILTEHKY